MEVCIACLHLGTKRILSSLAARFVHYDGNVARQLGITVSTGWQIPPGIQFFHSTRELCRDAEPKCHWK